MQRNSLVGLLLVLLDVLNYCSQSFYSGCMTDRLTEQLTDRPTHGTIKNVVSLDGYRMHIKTSLVPSSSSAATIVATQNSGTFFLDKEKWHTRNAPSCVTAISFGFPGGIRENHLRIALVMMFLSCSCIVPAEVVEASLFL